LLIFTDFSLILRTIVVLACDREHRSIEYHGSGNQSNVADIMHAEMVEAMLYLALATKNVVGTEHASHTTNLLVVEVRKDCLSMQMTAIIIRCVGACESTSNKHSKS
jgi:hypothetical protein